MVEIREAPAPVRYQRVYESGRQGAIWTFTNNIDAHIDELFQTFVADVAAMRFFLSNGQIVIVRAKK